MRRDAERLRDILRAIEAIERYAGEGRQRFEEDELVRTWCLHHLVVIGEAAAALSEPLRAAHRDVPWRAIVGMRNAIVHGYFRVDWNLVWGTVERDLPELRVRVAQVLASLERGGLEE